MSYATTIMYLVALAALVVGVVIIARPTPSEAAVYRHRIFGTMLIAFAVILAGFATVGWYATPV